MTAWLKLVGAVDSPMPEAWLGQRSDLHIEVGFTRRASVEIGEELVLYAIPQRKIIGLAEVLSHPIKSDKKGEERWPWRSRIHLKIAIANYERAPDLEDIEELGGRNLRKSVRRQSHIELRWGEYARARDALTRACDTHLGDVCE